MATVDYDIKAEAHRLVDKLPDGASWGDLMYLIYARQQIEDGIRAADEGRVVTTEELRKNLGMSR